MQKDIYFVLILIIIILLLLYLFKKKYTAYTVYAHTNLK